MTTSAFLGSQTLLKLGDSASPEVFTTIGEVVSIDALSQLNEVIEVTHLQSTAKEFIYGLSDGQQVKFTCNYIPANAQHVALLAAQAAKATKNFKYTLPATAGGLSFSFSALVMGSHIGPTAPNQATHIDFTLKITGAITGPA